MPRPRIHPVGAEPTGADRSRASRAQRIAAGWRIVQVALSPAAVAALATIRQGAETERDAIERVLVEASMPQNDP